MNENVDKNITKGKCFAWIGILLMGISSFLACLATTKSMSNVGSALLIVSQILTTYGFYYWRP